MRRPILRFDLLQNPLEMLKRPGTHEKRITELFAGRTRFSGDTAAVDTPLLIMGFTNRCGSHLLGDFLRQTGQIGGLGEFCNHDVVANMQRDFPSRAFPDHFAALARRTCPEGQVFGIKASWDQIAMLLRWNIPAMFSEVRLIHMSRQDKVAQAVSYSIARQTGVWTSLQKPGATKPKFLADEIGRIIAGNVLANELIRLIGVTANISQTHVTYEQLVRDTQLQIHRLLGSCGLESQDWAPRPPHVKRQTSQFSRDFGDAYNQLLCDALGIEGSEMVSGKD